MCRIGCHVNIYEGAIWDTATNHGDDGSPVLQFLNPKIDLGGKKNLSSPRAPELEPRKFLHYSSSLNDLEGNWHGNHGVLRFTI